jgi:hypothetical protein
VVAVVNAPAREVALVNPGLCSLALDIVHPDRSRSGTKHGTVPHLVRIRVPQHPANDVAIGQTPVVITNSSPDSVKVDFYAAFECVTVLVETSVVVYGEADFRSIWYYVVDGTEDASIFIVRAVMDASGPVVAFAEGHFVSVAQNFVPVNGDRGGRHLGVLRATRRQQGTEETKLSAGNVGIFNSPSVVTYCTPGVVDPQLNSTVLQISTGGV